MNERIIKLAHQAGYSKNFLTIGLPSNLEKLAELIVREFAHDCMDSADVTYYYDISYHVEDVAKKWGVEL